MLGCFSFDEPAAYIIAGLIGAALEKQIAPLSADNYGVSITLAASLHCCGLSYVNNAVDLICNPVLPDDFSREHNAVLSEVDLNLNIHF